MICRVGGGPPLQTIYRGREGPHPLLQIILKGRVRPPPALTNHFPNSVENSFKSRKLVVAKMASHAIFQYNILVIDIDNTTLGLI